MDKEKRNANIVVDYDGYTIRNLEKNVTQLEMINTLCREASDKNRLLFKAKIIMKPASSILLENNKSL